MRKPRERSKNGFYHVCMRGVNRQDIFLEQEDKKIFLKFLEKYSVKYKVEIHSYSLLNNHIHLEIKDINQNISIFMQCLCSVYARYFNFKYDRIGHLFQERYASEVIKNESQYLCVLRYILQNPVKAGISKTYNYKWSSYSSYVKKNPLVITAIAIKAFKNTNQLYNFIEEQNNHETFVDIKPTRREKEQFYIEKIKRLWMSKTPYLEPGLSRKEIVNKLSLLRKNNISISTISRITGIPRYLINLAK